MTDDDVITVLREKAASSTPVQLAIALGQLAPAGLTQGTIVTYFFRAFPGTPIGVLMEAGGWHRVSSGCMTDDEFDALLSPYLRTVS